MNDAETFLRSIAGPAGERALLEPGEPNQRLVGCEVIDVAVQSES